MSEDARGCTSPEQVVHALYDAISGPRDRPRDWNYIRGLLHPISRFRPLSATAAANAEMQDLDVDAWFVRANARFCNSDFFERGVILDVVRSARIVSLISPYESREHPDCPPFERGVNHFTLVNLGHGWRILQTVWEIETATSPLPSEASAALAKSNRA